MNEATSPKPKIERRQRKMYKFKVVFINRETGEKKSCTVQAPGIIPAIESAVRKMMLFGWDIKSATALY